MFDFSKSKFWKWSNFLTIIPNSLPEIWISEWHKTIFTNIYIAFLLVVFEKSNKFCHCHQSDIHPCNFVFFFLWNFLITLLFFFIYQDTKLKINFLWSIPAQQRPTIYLDNNMLTNRENISSFWQANYSERHVIYFWWSKPNDYVVQ